MPTNNQGTDDEETLQGQEDANESPEGADDGETSEGAGVPDGDANTEEGQEQEVALPEKFKVKYQNEDGEDVEEEITAAVVPELVRYAKDAEAYISDLQKQVSALESDATIGAFVMKNELARTVVLHLTNNASPKQLAKAMQELAEKAEDAGEEELDPTMKELKDLRKMFDERKQQEAQEAQMQRMQRSAATNIANLQKSAESLGLDLNLERDAKRLQRTALELGLPSSGEVIYNERQLRSLLREAGVPAKQQAKPKPVTAAALPPPQKKKPPQIAGSGNNGSARRAEAAHGGGDQKEAMKRELASW